MTERDHRIGAGCAKSWNIAGDERDRRKRDGDENEGSQVERANAVKQSRQGAGREERQDQANDRAKRDKFQRMAHDHS